MTATKKIVLTVLGTIATALLIGQLVMGLLLAGGRTNLITAHQHTGYIAVPLAVLYITLSLVWTLNLPTRQRGG